MLGRWCEINLQSEGTGGRKPDLSSPALLLIYLRANVQEREVGGGVNVCVLSMHTIGEQLLLTYYRTEI